MKKFLLIIMTVGSLITLNANEVRVSEVLDNYISAWNEHDLQKIDGFYADDVIWYDSGYDYTTIGKKNVSKAITDAFMGYVPDMYWAKYGDVFISGDTIIYEWIYGGTFNGKWDGTIIKNKKFEIKGLSTTTINKDGKIVSHKDYYDLHGFKKQLGLIQ
jgi:steroid delta-isomerase-like uncharacterized protein